MYFGAHLLEATHVHTSQLRGHARLVGQIYGTIGPRPRPYMPARRTGEVTFYSNLLGVAWETQAHHSLVPRPHPSPREEKGGVWGRD